MSEATPIDHPPHPAHLAHHFDSLHQQYASAKLGMWVFLGTEILMFGGLFCAYGVYRYGHPDVFSFAHQALDPVLGAINTAVLIASSFTMALAVRYSQLGQTRALTLCLALTILGGAGFMVIKTVEYKSKWEAHLFPGKYNVFNEEFKGAAHKPQSVAHGHASHEKPGAEPEKSLAPSTAPTTMAWSYPDPLAGTPDAPRIKATFVHPTGLRPEYAASPDHAGLMLSDLKSFDQQRINTFFSIYFLMTGLHGLHVIIGMGLIAWIMVRARRGEFSPTFFTPVDLVGLYWHLVDLIWIFLFPLLYLIH